MKRTPLFLLLMVSVATLTAQTNIKPDLFKELEYRNLGAFRTGAWIADIAAPVNPDASNK